MSAKQPAIESLLNTLEPPDLGPGPRPGVRGQSELNQALDSLVGQSPASDQRTSLLRALILLWHDHLDAAHVIAQKVENADGSFVHGIVHRREPDFSNAKYWFRRVGAHPIFRDLTESLESLSGSQPDLAARLISRGLWDPFAMIDACQQAANLPAAHPERTVLRQLQALETKILLAWFVR